MRTQQKYPYKCYLRSTGLKWVSCIEGYLSLHIKQTIS